MRYDAEHKQRTREKVLQEAAKAIRAEGPHKIGVAEVMSRAGLTHGGFYAHFPSKDAFVDAAVEQMFKEARARIECSRQEAGSPSAALSDYLDFYLSPAHRDARTSGCPLPFLSADAPRLPNEIRGRYAEGVQRLIATIADLLSQMGEADPNERAGSAVAEMVGALALARAEPDTARSDSMLDRSRRAVKARLGLI